MPRRKPKDNYNIITNLLYKELSETSCNTCRFNSLKSHSNCDSCSGEDWGASKQFAKVLAIRVLDKLKNN